MTSHRDRPAPPGPVGSGASALPIEPTEELDLNLEEHSGAAEKATSVELPRPARRGQRKPMPGPAQNLPARPKAEDDSALDELPELERDEPAPAPSAHAAVSGAGNAELTRGSTQEPSPTLDGLVGRVLGSFRLLRPLASGGMGAVFLARKEGLSGIRQHAAVKLVHAQLSGQRDFIDMFLDEARIASHVQHPNVCRVLDFGVADGTYYLAMEYVHGETWAELLARLVDADDGVRLMPSLVAFVLAQTCEGLHAAHVATGDDGQPLQIVHRDVSPQNIFVAYDGTVRVIDFGVARARDRITSTRAGVVKGKIAYMSPEQITGENVDARSDVWALGVILREALENRRLFRRNNDTETIRALVLEPIPEWSVPVEPALRKIANRALERDPAQRFQSAREMGAALDAFLLTRKAPLGTPELSALMHRLFADELAQKRALLRSEATPPEPRPAARGERTLLSEHPEPSYLAALRTARWAVPLAVLVLVGSFLLLRSRLTSHVSTSALVRNDADSLEARPLELQALAPEVERPKSPLASEPPSVRAEHGSLLVAYAGGWAEVYERGRLLGTTPGRFRLAVGPHTLLIKPFGKGPGFTRQVTITSAGSNKLLIGQ